jgi:hypothetical protein
MRQRAGGAGGLGIEFYRTTDLVVTLTSSDPSVATVPATVTLPAYNNYLYFDVVGGDTVGTVRIKMEADGFDPAYMDVEVGRPRLIVNYSDNEPANTFRLIGVYAADQYGNERTPLENITVRLASSDPTVASTDSTQVTILANPCSDVCPEQAKLIYRKPGTTVFSARDSRYPALIGYRPFLDTVTVTKPYLNLQPLAYYLSGTYVGAAQQDSMILYLPNTAAFDATFSITSSDPSVEVPATVTVPEGESMVYVPIYGRSLSYGAQVTASAPGYFSSSRFAYVRKGALDFELTGTPNVGQATVVRVRTWDPYDQYYDRGFSAVTSQQTIQLSADPSKMTIVAMDGVTPITSITVDAGSYQSAEFKIIPLVSENLTLYLNSGEANSNFAEYWSQFFAYVSSPAKAP